jgi:hypothetical protein
MTISFNPPVRQATSGETNGAPNRERWRAGRERRLASRPERGRRKLADALFRSAGYLRYPFFARWPMFGSPRASRSGSQHDALVAKLPTMIQDLRERPDFVPFEVIVQVDRRADEVQKPARGQGLVYGASSGIAHHRDRAGRQAHNMTHLAPFRRAFLLDIGRTYSGMKLKAAGWFLL